MESHEWRAKQLEDTLNGPVNVDYLLQLAKVYNDYLTTNGDTTVNDSTKAELILSYEDDLVRHLENVKVLADKADKVLDVEKWPDLSGFEKRLDKLETIARDQYLQSATLDSRTEELIEVYNDIINSFKKNAILWNQKLEAYEMEDKKMDQDE